ASRAGVGALRGHDLRHTGASWAVQSGVTLQELMVLGDWRSYPMVLRYAHLAPSHAAEAAERVAQWAHSEIRARRRGKGKRAKKQPRIGGAEGDRTLDLRIANATLSQLSYRPTAKHPAKSRSPQIASECPPIKMRDFAGTRAGARF